MLSISLSLWQPSIYGNHLPDTSDWILHDGAFVTHHGSPVTYDISDWISHDGAFVTHQGSPVTYGG